MLIKIAKGNYGYNNGVTVRVKKPSDKPFSVSDEEARRLVALGVAEIVSEGGILPASDEGTDIADIKEDAPEIENEFEIPLYNDLLTRAELQAIAKEYGIEISDRATKSEMIKALDDYFADMPDPSEV